MILTAPHPTWAQGPNLLQSRGLQSNRCYQASVSFQCENICTIDLFPKTQAGISLISAKTPPALIKAPGHFFKIKFRVIDIEKSQAQILSWETQTRVQLSDSLRHQSGVLKSIRCP